MATAGRKVKGSGRCRAATSGLKYNNNDTAVQVAVRLCCTNTKLTKTGQQDTGVSAEVHFDMQRRRAGGDGTGGE
jgi:hypothetical protein